MSYRSQHEFSRIEYILYLEREVERLSHYLNDGSGGVMLREVYELEEEVQRLNDALTAKDAVIAQAQSLSGVTALREENLRLNATISSLRSEIAQTRSSAADENGALRRQVAALMAAAPVAARRPQKVEVRDVAAAWAEDDGGRGRWAGLELD